MYVFTVTVESVLNGEEKPASIFKGELLKIAGNHGIP